MNEELLTKVRNLEALKNVLASTLKDVEGSLADALDALKKDQEATETVERLLAGNKFYQDKKTRRLAEYFKEKGYLITDVNEVTELNKAKYALAKHILTAVEVFKPFLRLIYERKEKTYDLVGLDSIGNTAICNFCTQLKKIGWLDFTKNKNELALERKIPKSEYVFFNGGWAEDATRYMIEKTLHDSPVNSRAVYSGVKLERLGVERNKDLHELDLVVEFKDRFYIFETKSGVTLGVERWIDHARLFNDEKGPNRFIMCCADDSIDARLFRPYRVLHLNRIGEEFSQMLRNEFKTSGGIEVI